MDSGKDSAGDSIDSAISRTIIRPRDYLIDELQHNCNEILGAIGGMRSSGTAEAAHYGSLVQHLEMHRDIYRQRSKVSDVFPNFPYLSWKDFFFVEKYTKAIKYEKRHEGNADLARRIAAIHGRMSQEYLEKQGADTPKPRMNALTALFNELALYPAMRADLLQFFWKGNFISSLQRSLLDDMAKAILRTYPTKDYYYDLSSRIHSGDNTRIGGPQDEQR